METQLYEGDKMRRREKRWKWDAVNLKSPLIAVVPKHWAGAKKWLTGNFKESRKKKFYVNGI